MSELPAHPEGDEQFLYRWNHATHGWMRFYFNGDKLELDRHRHDGGSLSETCFTCNMPLKDNRVTAKLECLVDCPSAPHEITVQACNQAEAQRALDRLRFWHTMVGEGRVSDQRLSPRPKPKPRSKPKARAKPANPRAQKPIISPRANS